MLGSKKRIDNFRKTTSLRNPFFDKNIVINSEKEIEKHIDIQNEFRNSKQQRFNLEKKSTQIDEQINKAMNEIKTIQTSIYLII